MRKQKRHALFGNFFARLAHTPAVQIAAEIEAMDWLALDGPHPATLAPLLHEQVLPALQQMAD